MNPATTNMKPNDASQQLRAETAENQWRMLCCSVSKHNSLIYLSISLPGHFCFSRHKVPMKRPLTHTENRKWGFPDNFKLNKSKRESTTFCLTHKSSKCCSSSFYWHRFILNAPDFIENLFKVTNIVLKCLFIFPLLPHPGSSFLKQNIDFRVCDKGKKF